MKLVVVESPLAGDLEKNLAYARAAMRDCFGRGEAPFASHALYAQPGVLRDDILDERLLGITAGYAWGRHAEIVAFYTDLGWSPGMLKARDRLRVLGEAAPYMVERVIPNWRYMPGTM